MTKRNKWERRIRQNVNQVRVEDLDLVLRAHDFDGDADAHHVVYIHRRYADIVTNVPKPHGGATHVKSIYVGKALAAIDEADRRDAAQEAK
jgi:hypothetical protein